MKRHVVRLLPFEEDEIRSAVNFRPTGVIISALVAVCFLWLLGFVFLDVAVLSMSLQEALNRDGSACVIALILLGIALYLTIPACVRVARAEEDYDVKFRFWD